MKIAIFNPYNFEKPGGVQDHVRAQAEQLQKNGHDVIILTPRPRKFTGSAPAGVIFTGVSARVRAQSSTVDISGALDQDEIERLYRDNIFDVAHFHEPIVPFVGRQLISLCPYPVVATLHAALPETSIGRTLGSIKPYFRSVMQHVDVLTRVSVAAGEYLEEVIDGVDTYFVPNGIELGKYTKATKKPRDPATILFIGRLEKRKGPKYLIRAFALIQQKYPNAKLVLAGDGPERGKLKTLISELNLNNVEMLGYIDEDHKKKLLATATVSCYPALYGESFGIVLLEAMASGVPIVAGRNPGYETVLRERGAIGLVDPKDTYELARRLELFLIDKTLRDFISDWGLEFVKQYDYQQIVKQYEKVYKHAIKKHKF